jgi:serine/threonine-protein kinase
VLVDFGVARSAEAASLTGVNELVGTALYMAPEQVAKRAITPATDIYALGAVGYHCLAGHPPFMGDNALTIALSHLDEEPPPLPDEVPQAVRTVIATAMAKDPADRFKNAAAMAQIAEAAIGRSPAETTTTSMTRAGTTALLAGGPATTRPRPGGYAPGAAPVGRGPGDTFAGSDPRLTGTSTRPAHPSFPAAPSPAPPGRRKRLTTTHRAGIVAAVLIGVAAVVMAFALANLGNDANKDGGTVPSQPAEVSAGPDTGPAVPVGPALTTPTKPRNTNSPRNGGQPTATTKPTGGATKTPDKPTEQPTTPPATNEPTTDPTDGSTGGPGPGV